jgi:putative photosynthetic complex assembly protein
MNAHAHHDHHREQMPKVPLYAAAALIITTLVLVGFVRLTGIGELRTPQAAVTAERHLLFADLEDGGISMRDAGTGELLERVEPGTNGFLRGALRGLARDRKREGIGPEIPLRLTSRADGRLLLEDPATRRLIDLGAFGAGNVAIFTRALADTTPPAAASVAAASPNP